jgi:hypothetical protein
LEHSFSRLARSIVPFINCGVPDGCIKYPIMAIPNFNNITKPNITKIKKAILAIKLFDSKNSFVEFDFVEVGQSLTSGNIDAQELLFALPIEVASMSVFSGICSGNSNA